MSERGAARSATDTAVVQSRTGLREERSQLRSRSCVRCRNAVPIAQPRSQRERPRPLAGYPRLVDEVGDSWARADDEAEKRDFEEQVALAKMIDAGEAEVPADSPYFDSHHQPQLADAFVLFLDLLGTSGVRGPSDARHHLQVTRRAMEQARRWSLSAGGDKQSEGAIYSFSDNIGLGYPTASHLGVRGSLSFLLVEVSYLQLAFANLGFFTRGAIARDGFFADPRVEFIHGPALNRAVLLEKSRALYPRVILDEATVAEAHAGLAEEGQQSDWNRLLLVDEAGAVSVNYLLSVFDEVGGEFPEPAATLRLHAEHIQANLHRFDGMTGVEEKYRWLAAYHNYFVGHFTEAKLDGPVETVTCSRPIGEFRPLGS